MDATAIEDEIVGRFERTRLVNAFMVEYKGSWDIGGSAVDVTLYTDEKRNPAPTVQHAREFHRRLQAVLEEAARRSVEHYVPDYTEVWRSEGEPAPTVEGFRERLKLTEIMFHHSGEVTLWYDVGDLLGDHLIDVRMTSAGEFVSTSLQG